MKRPRCRRCGTMLFNPNHVEIPAGAYLVCYDCKYKCDFEGVAKAAWEKGEAV